MNVKAVIRQTYTMKAPTVGWVFGLIGTHVMRHVGHRIPVRRTLNKAIVI